MMKRLETVETVKDTTLETVETVKDITLILPCRLVRLRFHQGYRFTLHAFPFYALTTCGMYIGLAGFMG